MNKIYKVIFNKTTQTFIAVSELTRGRTKSQTSTHLQTSSSSNFLIFSFFTHTSGYIFSKIYKNCVNCINAV
ncbi:ESPR domain-containing protein [Phocoenobacter uteri]|uniref:ESPR domain-containing protein n=1 Tax=Phocoenobacter uteri TaxID=146806 RepID=UPI000E1C2316